MTSAIFGHLRSILAKLGIPVTIQGGLTRQYEAPILSRAQWNARRHARPVPKGAPTPIPGDWRQVTDGTHWVPAFGTGSLAVYCL